MVAVVDDTDVLEKTETPYVSLFVRGTSRAMFENVYALSANYSKNTNFDLVKNKLGNKNIFGTNDNEYSADKLSKYSISGLVQSSFLSGVGTDLSNYNIYYEEFGTIMRECAYITAKFDKAYPSLLSKIVTPYSNDKGYTISGFSSTPYGAEFLIFNHTDRPLEIGSGTGNPIGIIGLTLTNDTQNELTVDDYFAKRSDLSNTEFVADSLYNNPSLAREDYIDIKNSRATYGKKDFSLDSLYIQTQDSANDVMGWIVKKIMKPRRSVGVEVFGLPILQLGDIVEIEYDVDGVNQIVAGNTRFVVYCIENNVSSEGPTMNVYLSEVV
jgi:hypothetical protein